MANLSNWRMYAIDDVIKIRGKHWLLPTLSIYIYLTFFSTAGRIPQKRISLMNVGCLSIGACRGPLRTAHSPARENEVYHYIYCVRQFSLSLSMLGLRSIFPFIYPFRNEISYLILYKRERRRRPRSSITIWREISMVFLWPRHRRMYI